MAQPAGNIIGFIEPSIQHAEIQYAIHARFHAAGAAGFFSAAGIVQPEIDALHHFARDLNAVVLNKDQTLGDFRVARHGHNLADQRLAFVIFGMRFARNDNLHRHLRIVQKPLQSGDIAEQQRSALVRGESAVQSQW